MVGVNAARCKLQGSHLGGADWVRRRALREPVSVYRARSGAGHGNFDQHRLSWPCWAAPGTFIGPLVGSVVLESAAEVFKNVFKEAHLLIYGVLIVLVVLFMPEGIVGTVARKLALFKKAPPAPFAAPVPSTSEEDAERVAINK